MDVVEQNKQVVRTASGGKEKDKYTFKEVIHFMSQAVSPEPTYKKKPSYIKKGDVFQGSSINFKNRPFVVAKVTENGCYCIALTSGENDYSSIKFKSRFFGEGFLGNTLYLVSHEAVLGRFTGVFEDTRSLNKATQLILQTLIKNFT